MQHWDHAQAQLPQQLGFGGPCWRRDPRRIHEELAHFEVGLGIDDASQVRNVGRAHIRRVRNKRPKRSVLVRQPRSIMATKRSPPREANPQGRATCQDGPHHNDTLYSRIGLSSGPLEERHRNGPHVGLALRRGHVGVAARNGVHVQAARLVKSLQPKPVLQVLRRLAQRHHLRDVARRKVGKDGRLNSVSTQQQTKCICTCCGMTISSSVP